MCLEKDITRGLSVRVALSFGCAGSAAEDEFQELCFEFGLELDDVVRPASVRNSAVLWCPRVVEDSCEAREQQLLPYSFFLCCFCLPRA